MPDDQPFIENKDAGALAQAIVDTVREPLLVLDKDQRVLAASRSFYQTFKVAGPTPKASCFTRWAMVNGTFRGFDCSWKGSCRSTA
jgi:hypothetical protein